MNSPTSEAQSDIWSDWLLHRRHGDSAEQANNLRPAIQGYADHVLNAAKLSQNMTLVDIGSGDGLIAFAAIERIGPSLKVILTDISAPMLQHARQQAMERGILSQCNFIEAPAEDLSAIPDNSVDVVITRSVLAYVTNKRQALQEMRRMLRPGGRIALAEPVFRDDAVKVLAMKNWVTNNPDHENARYMRLMHLWKAAQFPDTMEKIAASPMTNYSERDLFLMAGEAGFAAVHVELHLDSVQRAIVPWEKYIECSPHPLAPTLGEILRNSFTPEDRLYFEQALRPLLATGELEGVERMVYLTGIKPI